MLTFHVIARKGQNAQMNGVIYIHSWQTGSQELVFVSHEAARRFATDNSIEIKEKTKRLAFMAAIPPNEGSQQ